MGILESISHLVGKGKCHGGSRDASPADKSVLLDKIRQSELFRDLPPTNLDEMFSRMETVRMKAGETIIQEGDEGDYYYLLVSGTATVSRRRQNDPNPQVVAELGEPVGFGEEALISNAKRNATVAMKTNGTLMRLSKDAFNDYVKEPLITWLSPKEAQDKVSQGAKWIDVRDRTGSREAHLPGSVSLPMEQLRDRMSELEKGSFYICYCDNGRLSSTAAFLLRQRGYNVGVLRGGLQSLKRAGMA
jgi:rhodanese-related sulfurtransferase